MRRSRRTAWRCAITPTTHAFSRTWRSRSPRRAATRSDSALPPRARARQLARRRALRPGVFAAAARRSRRGGATPEDLPRAPAARTRRAEVDRARDPDAARPSHQWGGRGGGRRGTRARRRREDGKLLTRTVALLTLAAVFACKINTDLDQPVAIDIVLPDSGRVEVTDPFRPRARALNGIGDSVQAELSWASLDTAVLAVLDSTTGVSISKTIGSARLQARTGNLFSNPQTVTVL